MRSESHRNLESLAEHDPVSRPLALLQLQALQEAAEPLWEQLASSIPVTGPESGIPALHGQSIPIDPGSVSNLLVRLGRVLSEAGIAPGPDLGTAAARIDPVSILKASIEWDGDALEHQADRSGIDLPVLAILGQCASLPAMLAIGRHLNADKTDGSWEPGYCPVCGSWPIVAEQRGLDRQQWLRCGRCSAGWNTRHQRCIYCDNTDHKRLGYMAAENERESRRVVTCNVCHGYLKVFATVSAFPIADLLRRDLESLELDVAAIDDGFSRPESTGFPLQIEVFAVENSRRGWIPWN